MPKYDWISWRLWFHLNTHDIILISEPPGLFVHEKWSDLEESDDESPLGSGPRIFEHKHDDCGVYIQSRKNGFRRNGGRKFTVNDIMEYDVRTRRVVQYL